MKSVYKILEQFNREHLNFPPYVAAFREVEDLIGLYRETGLAQHMLILGEAGTGKTTLCRDIVQKYPRFSLPHQDVVPALHVSIPSAATISSAVEAMLARLGDPSPTTGTASAKTARAITLARTLKLEVLLIDEAQHIQDRGQLPTQYLVGDWLKTVIDELNVPTVMLGLPRTEALLQVNEQLRRRFTRRRDMRMGQDPERNIEAECLQLFLSLGITLPVPIHTGGLEVHDLSARVYYACDGRVAYVKKLLAGAIRLVAERDLTEIRPEVLAEAFTREVWWEGIGELNPFTDNFVHRRLNRPNEPFERGQPGKRRSYREVTR